MGVVQDLKKIEITPNGKGGMFLFINGEKVDLKDVTEIRIAPLKDEKHRKSLIFELSVEKRICFLQDYSMDSVK